MTIPFEKLKSEWMKDAAFRAEYEALKPEFDRLRALVEVLASVRAAVRHRT